MFKNLFFNLYPNGLSKSKAFEDNKLKMAEIIQLLTDRVEKIVRKRQNIGSLHFLLFLQCFKFF